MFHALFLDQESGKRVLIAAPFDKVVAFAALPADASLAELQRWAMISVMDEQLAKMKAEHLLIGATCTAGSLVMVPTGYMVWELTHENCHGVRLAFVRTHSEANLAAARAWAHCQGQSMEAESVKIVEALLAAVSE